MTRRIALAILFVVWLALLGAGLTTYFITRSILIADLDDSIIARVAALPDVEPPTDPVSMVSKDSAGGTGDSYVITNNRDDKKISSVTRPPPNPRLIPQIQYAVFTAPDADSPFRKRKVTLTAYRRRFNQTDDLQQINITYFASAEHIDILLRNLTYSLTAFGLAAAAASMLAARVVARAVTQPIRDAADIIGKIDERSLNRRISTQDLPSELTPVATRLNDMLARLETAFAQRKQFLADASHELRTPVAALVVTLEVALRRQRDISDYVRALDRCLSDARQLHLLVVALVDQARAERFGDEPEVAPVAISTLLQQCAQMVTPLAESKGVGLIRNIPANLIVLSDEQFLRSMVSNLLSNAVEYTPARPPVNGTSYHDSTGRITLSASLELPTAGAQLPRSIARAKTEGVDESPRRLVIQVKDNGPGIPEKLRDHIFEPFFRADASRANPGHHLGLGLALVQSHARALGGSCTVQCPPPGETTGCLFTLDLPTLQIHADPAPQPAAAIMLGRN